MNTFDVGDSVFHVRDDDGSILALVVRSTFRVNGLSFLTEESSALQVGYMTRPIGEVIVAHVHEPIVRNIVGTQEVLVIQEGKVRLDLFSHSRQYVASVTLNEGDLVLLSEGGHGIEVIEEARIIEVKQGPFVDGKDKTRFEPVLPSSLNSLDL
jgi:hypothetical protein